MTSGSISGTDNIFATQEETKDSFECYHFKIKKKDYIGLKDCLVANSIIYYSFRGFEFSSQHPHRVHRTFYNSSSRRSKASGLHGHPHTLGIHSYKQTLIFVIKTKIKFLKYFVAFDWIQQFRSFAVLAKDLGLFPAPQSGNSCSKET